MKNFRIVVTDSGLGGLSVAAELENRIAKLNSAGNVELIFFNSLASADLGYNDLPDMNRKAEVFDSALSAIADLYNPDLILIACNTLSVVYEFTEFAQNNNTEVLGIIESGVDSAKRNFADHTAILLLGTPTTIDSKVYQKRLIELGIDENLITAQSCPKLETEIQNDPFGGITSEMIKGFFNEAKQKLPMSAEKIIAVLCCTHYGYSEKLFDEHFRKRFGLPFAIVNPNLDLAQKADEKIPHDQGKANTSVRVISQVKLKENEITAISNILQSISEKTAEALKCYSHTPGVFEF